MKRVLVLAALLFVFVPDTARACSCAALSPEAARDLAGAVFVGDVVSSQPASGGPRNVYPPEWATRFRVVEALKGVRAGAEVLVFAGREGSMCGVAFERGVRYLVFARARGDAWETDLCTRTRPLSQAERDLEVLRRK